MEQPRDAAARLPVSVLTGFLGSGKTTLLSRLLKHPAMAETAVIVNEFGEVGLDHALLETASEDDTVLLSSGCLCCTVRGELVDTLRELFFKRTRQQVPEFSRVVIETTGLADPAPILQTLMGDPLLAARYRLDGVITTVDAVNGWATLDRQMEAIKQAAVADRILLTKSDLAGAAATARLQERLRRLNPGAPILAAVQGDIHPDRLFDAGLYDPRTKTADVQAWLRAEVYAGAEGLHQQHEHGAAGTHADVDDHGHGHHHDHGHGHHGHGSPDVNRHDERIHAFCLLLDAPIEWDRLTYWLEMLAIYRGEDLLRMKGLINVQDLDRPVAIHGVQHLFHPPAVLDAWPDADRRSRIVFITRDLSREAVEATLKAVFETAPPAAAG